MTDELFIRKMRDVASRSEYDTSVTPFLTLGYEYDENDVHDVLLLCRTFNLEIPEQYKTHI